MSTITPELLKNCKRCGLELAPGVLACGQCHALVHGAELDQLAAQAKESEAKGEWRQARELWLACLPLLPPSSKQAEWIKEHARELSAKADAIGGLQVVTVDPGNTWVKKLAPFGTLIAFIAVYSALDGPRFGIGFALLILIHEMGHFIDIKRRGLPADMPVFLPGLGAYVRWRALGVSLQTRAAVSLAGPLAGLLGSAVCTFLWWKTGDSLWASLARTNAWMNILNLIPVWVLDGGQAAVALSRMERVVLLIAALTLLAVTQERAFILVAAGAGLRIFAKDAAVKPSPAITAYFVVVLTLLALVMKFVPTQGTGM